MSPSAVFLLSVCVVSTVNAAGEERQVTFTPKNHDLDNNDNFSPDNRFLCYDTRGMVGPGIDNGQSIEKVELATGNETVIYAPPETVIGENAAPGVGAVTYCPVADKVAFIHGPLLADVPVRGYYGKPNRNGMEVIADGSGRSVWLDYRDVATDRPTLPGAHRGGTHRHEYSLDGRRVGFTYDDFLLPQYDRTIGFMVPRPDAPGNATHYFALLLAPPPMGTAKPGEIEKAAGDSWVGREGLMRAFIGKVRNPDGETYEESLFVVDIPADVDITTADAGDAQRYPAPPKGLTVRRLTHDWAGGIVRGSHQGDRIAYYAKAADGTKQIFIIASDGSDKSDQPGKRPIQATRFPEGAGAALRWHPSGQAIACIANNGVAVTCIAPGPQFGKSVFLTPQGDEPERQNLVWSWDGKLMAYTKNVPTPDGEGGIAKTYDGKDMSQIFAIDCPDLKELFPGIRG